MGRRTAATGGRQAGGRGRQASRVVALALVAVAAGLLDGPRPGLAATAVTLPDGRLITPAGTVVTSTDFPGGLALAPGGPLFVAGAGEAQTQLGAVDPTTLMGTYLVPTSGGNTQVLSGGMAVSPDGKTVYAAGASDGDVLSFTAATPPSEGTVRSLPDGRYAGGVSADPSGRWLFVTEPFDVTQQPFQRGRRLTRIPLDGSTPASVDVGQLPYPVATAALPSGQVVAAVGNEEDGTASVVDAATLRPLATIPVGRHPSNLVFTADGRDLLVVSSLDDRLDDVSTATWRPVATLSLSPAAGIGASPDGLAVSQDGARVYVPLAQDNAVAVVDRAATGALSLAGRIPTAWWPTAVALDEPHGSLLVAAGKGQNLAASTPPGIDAGTAPAANPGPIGAQNPTGTVERVPLPDRATLAAMSAQVSANNAWNTPAPASALCGPAEIRHVVWIIRENKTYDEELGDAKAGGDPNLTIYGQQITPNTHALADRFGLLTAFYDNEEVSDIGHPALAGGIASDWMERMVLQNYGGKEPVEYSNYGSDAQGKGYNDDRVQWGPAHYLMNDALAHGVKVLNFGYSYLNAEADIARATTPQEEASVVRDFPGYGFNLGVKDQDRAAFWTSRWNRDVAAGTVPGLEVVYLPDDHTGNGVPAQEVADNDLATGRIVEAVSNSSAWRNTAVFVEEDDPQSGVDHVDEHRSLALVVSPWTRTGGVSSVHHDQTSMLRTIELILGLPPLTEVDATATPFTELWAATPDLRPFSSVAPTVPAMTAAARAAADAYKLRLEGPHPDQTRLSATVQRDVQWMYARGVPFESAPPRIAAPALSAAAQEVRVGPASIVCPAFAAAARTAPPGSPGLVNTSLGVSAAPFAALAVCAAGFVLARRRRRA